MDCAPMANPPNKYRRYLRFSTVGLELGFAVIIGLVVGQYLDKWLGTEPWLLLLFLIFGMAAGFRSVFRLLKDMNVGNGDEEV